MPQFLSLLVVPTHPLGILFVFPAIALWTQHRFGKKGLTWLTSIALVAAAIFPLTRLTHDFLPVLGMFGFALGMPVVCAAVAVALLVPRKWPSLLVYASAVGAAVAGWFVALIAVLAVWHPVGGIA